VPVPEHEAVLHQLAAHRLERAAHTAGSSAGRNPKSGIVSRLASSRFPS
jgi:hypothetical protein